MALLCSLRALSFANRHARPTHATAGCPWWSVRVRGVIRMPGGTMRFLGVSRRRARRAPVVLGVCHNLHMPHVHTSACLAQMVDFKPRRNRTVSDLPGDTVDVGLTSSPSAGSDDAVAIAVGSTKPQPAIIRSAHLHAIPQALSCAGYGSRPLPLSTRQGVALRWR
jgi:hypothetical protein